MSERTPQRSGMSGAARSSAGKTLAACRFGVCVAVALVVFGGTVVKATTAGTLYEALRAAYATNPTIGAERAAVRISVQDVAASQTGFAPDISLNSDYGYRDRRGSAPGYPRTELTSHPRGFGVGLTQNLWNGFKTINSIGRDDAALLSQRNRLTDTEQTILADVASAYLDVVRDTAILKIQQQNREVLAERDRQSAYRFKIGEITKTDADQTAASLARSTADVALARQKLDGSRAVFTALVGLDPGVLARTGLPKARMPKSLQAALEHAMSRNPAIRAAQHAITAAERNIDVQRAGYLPSLDLTVSADRRWDPDMYQPKTQLNQMSVIGRLTVPLYDRGLTPVAVQRASEIRSQRQADLDRYRATVRANVVQAWSLYVASESAVGSAQTQIAANERALQGVTLEASVGQRTSLDVLITQQALLDSRVNLEVAEHDRLVAGFRLLALGSDLSLDTIRPQDLRYIPPPPPPSLRVLERVPVTDASLDQLSLRSSFN